jgi:predicted hydrocarbon binding protein
MSDLFNKLILARKLDFKKGEIALFGTNICLIPPEIYLLFVKELEKTKQESIVYESSFDSAKYWFSELSKKNSKITVEELVEFIPKIFNLLAIGKIELIEKDFITKKFKLELANSLIAELYGKSDHPVDIQFSGYLAGAFSFIFKQKMNCLEETCFAMGDKLCSFVISPGGD